MKRLLVLMVVLLGCLLPASASAYSLLGQACQGNQSAVACSASGNDPISGPNGVLKKVTLIIASVAGVAAVIVILFSGFSYITSGGDAQKAAGARKAILGAAIGLGIIVAATSIILVVIKRIG